MQRTQGFSLIELMIVVAIIGILAAVAVPSYQSFIQEGRRAEAVAFAMDIAARQERYYTQAATYTSKTDNTGLNLPKTTSENDYYNLTITDIGGNTSDAISTYRIRVSPNGFTDSDCHTLQIDNVGRRQIYDGTNVVSGAVAAECWR